MTPAVILLAPVLLLAGLAWWRLEQALAAFPLLFPDGTYLQLDAIVAVIGVWLMAGSFLLSRRWPSPARARVSLLFASIVLSFACVDAYVVLVRTDTSGPGGASSITMRRWFERYVTPHVNANGYWERDFRQATAGNLRPLVIAVVGDSMTWGQGVKGAEHRFTNVMERTLNERGIGVVVLNVGRGGARTSGIPGMVNDVAIAKPDVVIYAYLANDIEDYVTRPTIDLPTPALGTSTLRASPIYNWVYWQTSGVGAYREPGKTILELFARAYADPDTFNKHLADIDDVYDAIRAIGARPVLGLLPFHPLWTDPDYLNSSNQTPRQALRKVVYDTLSARAAAKEVPVLHSEDIELTMAPQKFAVSAGDSHPGPQAHAEIAAAFVAGLERAGMLMPMPRP